MADKITTKERVKERSYRVVPSSDRITIEYHQEDNLVHRIVSKAKDRTTNIVEYQKKNPDKVKLLNITFRHIGLLSIWYYKNEPYDIFIGNGERFDRLDKYELKKIWGGIVRTANHIRLLGRNNENAMQKRLEELSETVKVMTEGEQKKIDKLNRDWQIKLDELKKKVKKKEEREEKEQAVEDKKKGRKITPKPE